MYFFYSLSCSGRRLDNMNCVSRLFGLCMYALRGTGGLEEEVKE